MIMWEKKKKKTKKQQQQQQQRSLGSQKNNRPWSLKNM